MEKCHTFAGSHCEFVARRVGQLAYSTGQYSGVVGWLSFSRFRPVSCSAGVVLGQWVGTRRGELFRGG